MFDPKLTNPHPEEAKTYPQTVHCSVHNRDARIIVANWAMSEEGWSGWRVIDCSLLPPGTVQCGMDCLSQAKLQEE